jgi:hypothetical protein
LYRRISLHCGQRAQDENLTPLNRAELQFQQQMWLEKATLAEEEEDAHRIRIALRGGD